MLARRMEQHDLQECKPRPMLSFEADLIVYVYISLVLLWSDAGMSGQNEPMQLDLNEENDRRRSMDNQLRERDALLQ